MDQGRTFTTAEAETMWDIIRHRRDVRGNHFINKPIPPELLDRLLDAALHAPSVGFSQPWEFLLIENREKRQAIRESFNITNEAAKAQFATQGREAEYQQLKLEGILESAINIAVFYVRPQGPILGQTSMEDVGLYSTVCAVQNIWLMARALNIGVGWVSIVDPEKVRQILDVEADRQLVAYLCVGYTDGFLEQPELELLHWEKRKDRNTVIRKI
jgi:5,6-dimethylbenzimidazole synthase